MLEQERNFFAGPHCNILFNNVFDTFNWGKHASLSLFRLSADLQALSHRRDVASRSLFYKYYYGKCSSDLADLVPPKRVTVRSTHFSEQRLIQLNLLWAGLSFFPHTAGCWNSLPPDYFLAAFKGKG